MSANPKHKPILFAYGPSGSGKTNLILSQPALFNRPGVAIHGHPKEYRDMPFARVFGYERPPVASDPGVFREVLGNPGIDLLVIDEAAQAASSFGQDFPQHIVDSGKAALILVQGISEALDFVRSMTARRDGLVVSIHWKDTDLDKGPLMGGKEETGREVEPIVVPAVQRNAVLALCHTLLPSPEAEVW